MKKRFLIIFLMIQTSFLGSARASIFGEEPAVLVQILANVIKQLTELKSIVDNGKDTLSFLQDINRGINDSLRMAETYGIRIDPGLYKDLREIDQATRAIQELYGAVTDSKLAMVQRNTDQTVAEAVSFNNELNEYAKKTRHNWRGNKIVFASGVTRRSTETYSSEFRCDDSCPQSTNARTRSGTKTSGSSNGNSKQKRKGFNGSVPDRRLGT
jgi:hypothetical protein